MVCDWVFDGCGFCRPPDGKSEEVAVTEEDLEHLIQLVEVTDGGPMWHQMMDRSLPNMSYQAWRRDPKVCRSPKQVSH